MKVPGTRRLHFRLALRQTVWFAVLVSLVAWAAYSVMARRLYDQVDFELQDRAIAVRSMLQIRNSGITWLNDQADPEVREQFEKSIRYYQLLDSDGRPLEASGEFSAIRVPVSEIARQSLESGKVGWETFNGGGAHLRILDLGVIGRQSHRYLMRLGISLAHADEDAYRLLVFICLIFPVLVLAHGIICWLVAGSALRPLEAMSEAAKKITGSDLSRRLPVAAGGDELAQLGGSINAMISSFQNSSRRMNEFVGNLAHELRQPLTVLRAETEQALRTAHLEDDSRLALMRQLDNVDRASRVVADVLALARSDCSGIKLHRSTENLGELVKAAVDGMKGSAGERHVTMTVKVQPDVTGQFDAAQIWRLLLNLIDNAIKFNRPNGRVDVTLLAAGGIASIVVRDTGMGISAEEQAHIFDRSYRSAAARKSTVPGTGLGLHFARLIVEAHGGHIDLTSCPGEGSCFSVHLPLLSAHQPADFPQVKSASASVN